MTENENKIIDKFFADARRFTVADKGFSRRVSRALPQSTSLVARLWVAFCVLLGVVLACVCRVWQLVADSIEVFVRVLPVTDPPRFNVVHLFLAMLAVLVVIVREVIDRRGV